MTLVSITLALTVKYLQENQHEKNMTDITALCFRTGLRLADKNNWQ